MSKSKKVEKPEAPRLAKPESDSPRRSVNPAALIAAAALCAGVAVVKEEKKPEKKEIDQYALRRIRRGKTERDRRERAHERSRNNRRLRDEYVQWCRSTESKQVAPAVAAAKFPLHACNGRKSRRLKPRILGKKVA